MRKNFKYVIMVLLTLVLILIGVSSCTSPRNENETIKPGIYFRRQHSFEGVRAGHGHVLHFSVFNVGNQDISFFEDTSNLSFNVKEVDIISVYIRRVPNNVIKEVEFFGLAIVINMHVDTAQLT